MFHEYFHGDNGAGLGASHQTGWTGTVARLIQLFGSVEPAEMLHGPVRPFAHPYHPEEDHPAEAATHAPSGTPAAALP